MSGPSGIRLKRGLRRFPVGEVEDRHLGRRLTKLEPVTWVAQKGYRFWAEKIESPQEALARMAEQAEELGLYEANSDD